MASSSSSWTPDAGSVGQLVDLLKQTLSPDNKVQREATKALEQAKTMPDLNKYLVYLLVTREASADITARSSAGIMLKNNLLKSYASQPSDTLAYVKAHVVQGLVGPGQQHMVRNISGNVVTTVVAKGGVAGWPEILPKLMEVAEQAEKDVAAAEAAMSALAKICEDSAVDLDKLHNGARPVEYMIPKFLQFMGSPASPKVRSLSVTCLNMFATLTSKSLVPHIDEFLNALFNLARGDEYAETRWNVCTAFATVLSVQPDKLAPHLDGVVDFALHCIKDTEDSSSDGGDERVAREGCEFILHLAESDKLDKTLVSPHLERIVPQILSTMVYSETDQMLLENLAEDDENVEDKAQDIRPNMVKTKDVHKSKTTDNSESKNSSNNNEEDDDDFYEDDEDAETEAALSEWNLRKCSAAALDVFSTQFPDLVLEYSMPYLREGIVSPQWSVREAAILAFGAISNGCIDLVGPHLPDLVPFLVQTLRDPVPAVRQITCWTLGRYSSWVAYNSRDGSQHEVYLQPVLEGILGCCQDKNKKVQEAACVALGMVTEEAGYELLPYLEVILTQLAQCFNKYRARNLHYLYETLEVLLAQVGPAVAESSHDSHKLIEIIMPPLQAKWRTTSSEDRDVWPIFECMASVASAFGRAFAPYAAEVYTRGVNVISDILIQDQNCQNDDTLEEPDKEFAISALEMLDGVVQGLKGELAPLIEQTQPPLVELLVACIEDENVDVQQSAFALVGDLAASNNASVLRPAMQPLLELAVKRMDLTYGPGVLNNALWSVGELTLALGPEIEPFAATMLTRYAEILRSDDTLSSNGENAAIALGRLAHALPAFVAPHLHHFLAKWCYYIKEVYESDEKASAYLGLTKSVRQNPTGAATSESQLLAFIDCVACYAEPPAELQQEIRQVLAGFKDMLAGNKVEWESGIVAQTSQQAQEALSPGGIYSI